jgi:hypothetical protein
MLLTGNSGSAFFIQQVLLEKGLAQKVDIVRSVAEAEQLMQQSSIYHLLIIDLVERWPAGMQIGYEWQHISNPLRLFLLPSGVALPDLDLPNIARTRPEKLEEFVMLIYELCQKYCDGTRRFMTPHLIHDK